VWESENSKPNYLPTINDYARPGATENYVTRPPDGDKFVSPDEGTISSDLPIFDRDELLDVGDRRGFLLPGDLVEIAYVYSFIFFLDEQELI